MAQITISDDLADKLRAESSANGCSVEDLIHAALFVYLHPPSEMTTAQRKRLLESIEQVKRGDVVDGRKVMARFNQTLQRIATR